MVTSSTTTTVSSILLEQIKNTLVVPVSSWLSHYSNIQKSQQHSQQHTTISNSIPSLSLSLSLVTTICKYSIGCCIGTIFIVPWILATIAIIRNKVLSLQSFSTNSHTNSNNTATTTTTTSTTNIQDYVLTNTNTVVSLYNGTVWHTRYYPKYHNFQYPIYIFCINLNQYDEYITSSRTKNKNKNNNNIIKSNWNRLWPLFPSIFINFFPLQDHIKEQYISITTKKNTINNYENEKVTTSTTTNDTDYVNTTTTTTTTTTDTTTTNNNNTNTKTTSTSPCNMLCEKIYTIIKERTINQFCPSFDTHTILLLTNLTYYGYCFNPVSYYYIINIITNTIDCIVGEVSNTPWNEMYIYVLHPYSIDISITTNTTEEIITNTNNADNTTNTATTSSTTVTKHNQKLYYIFKKQFHVSPFMEMFYNYEWTFIHPTIINRTPTDQKNTTTTDSDSLIATTSTTSDEVTETTIETTTTNSNNYDLCIINNLRTQDEKNILQFHAKLLLNHIGSVYNIDDATTTTNSTTTGSNSNNLSPYTIAYFLTIYPMYCTIIQIWIHYEAFILFVYKNIEYQQHPNNSTTTVSRIISSIMTPIFILQDLYNNTKSKHKTTTQQRKPDNNKTTQTP